MEEFVAELEGTRRRAAAAERTLELLQSAVRGMARQTKQALAPTSRGRDRTDGDAHASAEPDAADGAVVQADRSLESNPLDDWGLGDLLVADPSTGITSDLMDLHNTIQMLQEHLRLSREEASEAQTAQVDCEAWRERALAAEAEHQRLAQENGQLASSLDQLSRERRLLIRECRRARKDAAQAEEKSLAKEMELYAVEALVAHEQQLSSGKISKNVGSEGAPSPTEQLPESVAVNATSLASKEDEAKHDEALEHTRQSPVHMSGSKLPFSSGFKMSSFVPQARASAEHTDAKKGTIGASQDSCRTIADSPTPDSSQENVPNAEKGSLPGTSSLLGSATKAQSIKFCPPGLASALKGHTFQYR